MTHLNKLQKASMDIERLKEENYKLVLQLEEERSATEQKSDQARPFLKPFLAFCR